MIPGGKEMITPATGAIKLLQVTQEQNPSNKSILYFNAAAYPIQRRGPKKN